MAYTPLNQTFLIGYNSFLTHQTNRSGGGCLAYIKRELPVFLLRHPVLDLSPENFWLPIGMHNRLVHLGCVYLPPSSNNLELPQLLKASEYIAHIHGEAKLIAGDFIAPEIC